MVGTDTTVDVVSAVNGYYKDSIIKLLLPPEGREVLGKLRDTETGNFLYKTTLKPIVDDVVLSLNRSAEDAANKAAPILKGAIRDITIKDAYDILYGEDSAATHYLRVNTYDSLESAYAPVVNNSLDKPLVGNQSANFYWDKFVTEYNKIVTNPINPSSITGLEEIKQKDLGKYATNEALDGLFYKVKQEEKSIRKNPVKRVTEILEKVFSQLDN